MGTKIIIKETGCFQSLEAVVTSTTKESKCSTECGSLQVVAVVTAVNNCVRESKNTLLLNVVVH